jgi:hypothetical protein
LVSLDIFLPGGCGKHIGKGGQDAIQQHSQVLNRAVKAKLAAVIKGVNFIRESPRES